MNEIIALLKGKGLNDSEIAALLKEVGKDKKANTYKMVEVIRLYWGDKPSKEQREEMGKAGFHWNSFEKFWFADVNDATVKFAAEHGFTEAK